MSRDPKKRPSSGVCPEKFCFHWVPPGGMADMTGATYPSREQALAANSRWTSFPTGGCACTWGPCARLDRKKGIRDFYEPCEPALEDAGLPWFYFSTLRNLHPDFHERFLKEASALSGAAAFEAGGVALATACPAWFYFSTLRNLHPDFHERCLKEASARWGAAAFEAGGVEMEEAARRLHTAIKAGEVEAVRDLLVARPEAVHWRNEQG